MATAALKLRDDLIVSRQGAEKDCVFVVKDPVTDRFFRLKEIEHFTAQQFDGAVSPDEVRDRIEEKFGVRLSPENLAQFVNRLQRAGLLTDGQTSAAPSPRRRTGGDLFYLRFRLFDPDHLFDRLIRKVRFLFT